MGEDVGLDVGEGVGEDVGLDVGEGVGEDIGLDVGEGVGEVLHAVHTVHNTCGFGPPQSDSRTTKPRLSPNTGLTTPVKSLKLKTPIPVRKCNRIRWLEGHLSHKYVKRFKQKYTYVNW